MENYLSEAAFNYVRNMTYVIFSGKWFLRPVVRCKVNGGLKSETRTEELPAAAPHRCNVGD
ncbi:hypothetical protein C1890_24585 [Pseudomonas sp. DP16D-R1]|nr:hypothetical protein C1890_24585 [Pseudomonas sp. DP16D-R1]